MSTRLISRSLCTLFLVTMSFGHLSPAAEGSPSIQEVIEAYVWYQTEQLHAMHGYLQYRQRLRREFTIAVSNYDIDTNVDIADTTSKVRTLEENARLYLEERSLEEGSSFTTLIGRYQSEVWCYSDLLRAIWTDTTVAEAEVSDEQITGEWLRILLQRPTDATTYLHDLIVERFQFIFQQVCEVLGGHDGRSDRQWLQEFENIDIMPGFVKIDMDVDSGFITAVKACEERSPLNEVLLRLYKYGRFVDVIRTRVYQSGNEYDARWRRKQSDTGFYDLARAGGELVGRTMGDGASNTLGMFVSGAKYIGHATANLWSRRQNHPPIMQRPGGRTLPPHHSPNRDDGNNANAGGNGGSGTPPSVTVAASGNGREDDGNTSVGDAGNESSTSRE